MRNSDYVLVEGTEDGIDFDAAYTIPGYRGVAWRLMGWAQVWEQETTLLINDQDDDDQDEWVEVPGEGEWVPDHDRVVARMVGDDRNFTFDRDEPEMVMPEGYCHTCGQIGCTWDVG